MLCSFDMATDDSANSRSTTEGATGLDAAEKVETNGFDIAFGGTILLLTCTDAGILAVGFGMC